MSRACTEVHFVDSVFLELRIEYCRFVNSPGIRGGMFKISNEDAIAASKRCFKLVAIKQSYYYANGSWMNPYHHMTSCDMGVAENSDLPVNKPKQY